MNQIPRDTCSQQIPVSLTGEDMGVLTAIRNSPAALTALSLDSTAPDNAVVRRIVELGLVRVQELLDEVGYAALAADPERTIFERDARTRQSR